MLQKDIIGEGGEKKKLQKKYEKNVMHLTTYAEIDVSDHALDF